MRATTSATSAGKRASLVAAVAIGFVVFCVIVMGGCRESGKEKTPARSEVVPELTLTPSEEPREVLLLEVVERHSDSFADRIAEISPAPRQAPPFWFDGVKVRIDSGLLETTDSATLADRDLTLGEPGTPLGKCGVFVISTVLYAGKGRPGGQASYLAFPSLPVRLLIEPGTPAGVDAIAVDPVRSSLLQAACSVRLVGPGGELLIGRRGGKDDLTVTYAGRDTGMKAEPGNSVRVHEESRDVHLSRAALTMADIEADPADGPVPEDDDEVVFPAVDWGTPSFTSELVVRCVGSVPVSEDRVEGGRKR